MSSTRIDARERNRQRTELTRTIQAEIIPRLMLAHRVDAAPRLLNPKVEPPAVFRFDVEGFVDRLLKRDAIAGHESIAKMRAEGAPLEAVFLELLAPAARVLGARWESDAASFTDVTVGLTHLQQLVREYAPAFEFEGQFTGTGHRAVLLPAPGDHHLFGLILLEEFFRRAGWDVLGAAEAMQHDILKLVQSDWVSLVGFSVADPRSVAALHTLIAELRATSLNPSLIVMVGGNCILDRPELVTELGADATGRTALDAVHAAERRLNELALSPVQGKE